jgi:hypothetical protein
MTATLTFQLPEERFDFDCATKGRDWRSVVSDLDEDLRQKVKHGDSPGSFAEAREMLHDLLRDYYPTLQLHE